MLVAAIAPLLAAQAAAATSATTKAIWGPAQVEGRSQFPIYRDLGVDIYEIQLFWADAAPTRPADPTNPRDPAYRWPAELDYAIREARRYGMRVSVQLISTPSWANGGRPRQWAPRRPRDFAHFAEAAARRYRSVHLWQIWGEPSESTKFQPMPDGSGTGPRAYSRLLDAAYVSLKRVSRRNLVIGGNTHTAGNVRPLTFVRSMRLPSGRPPRLDLYGHNPFTRRNPDLARPPLGSGYADFSDLDELARSIDRYLGRGRRRPIRIFISEFTVPTGPSGVFSYHTSSRVAAKWLRSAFRIAGGWSRIYALGWFSLYDQSPNTPGKAPGTEERWGLLDWQGSRKPAYYVYRRY